MKNRIQNTAKRIVDILSESPNNSVPRKTVEEQLKEELSLTEIRESIAHLLNEYIINLVVDYPEIDSTLYDGTPIWYLKLLESKERVILRNLSPIKQALFKILRETDDSYVPGELAIAEAEAILKSRGYDEKEIKWLHIEGYIEQVTITVEGKSVEHFRLIPEYEKTEEYKRNQEEQESCDTWLHRME